MPEPVLFRSYRCSCNYVALLKITISSIWLPAKKKFRARTELKVYCRACLLSFSRRGTNRDAACHCRKGIDGIGCNSRQASRDTLHAMKEIMPFIKYWMTSPGSAIIVFEKESPLLGPVKMSVTVINAGTQHNVVPDKCTFVVDIRSNELYSTKICLLKSRNIFPAMRKPVRSASTLHGLTKNIRSYRQQ